MREFRLLRYSVHLSLVGSLLAYFLINLLGGFLRLTSISLSPSPTLSRRVVGNLWCTCKLQVANMQPPGIAIWLACTVGASWLHGEGIS